MSRTRTLMHSFAVEFFNASVLVGLIMVLFDGGGIPLAFGGCLIAGLTSGAGSGLLLSIPMALDRRGINVARVIAADLASGVVIVTSSLAASEPGTGVLALAPVGLLFMFFLLVAKMDIRNANLPRRNVRAVKAESWFRSLRALGSGINSANTEILGCGAIGAVLGVGLSTFLSLKTGNGPGPGIGAGLGIIIGISAWLAAVLCPVNRRANSNRMRRTGAIREPSRGQIFDRSM